MKATVFNIQKFSLHDGPGIRTSIFFSGCPLRCSWCANPECHASRDQWGKTKEYEPEELLREVLKDKAFYDGSGGGVTLTGGELFSQYAFVLSFCRLLKSNGIHIAMESAGAVEPQRFAELVSLVDFVYIDCKHYDDEKHKAGTGISNADILRNIRYLASTQKPYCVRIPVIPGYNDSPADAEAFGKLLSSLGVQTVELLPFHQLGEGKYAELGLPYPYEGVSSLHKDELARYADIIRAKGLHVILK